MSASAWLAGCEIFGALGGGAGLPCNDDSACPADQVCFAGRCAEAGADAAVARDGSSVGDASRDVGAGDAWPADAPASDAPRFDGAHADVAAIDRLGSDASITDTVPDDVDRSDIWQPDAAWTDARLPDTLQPDTHVATRPTLVITPADGALAVAPEQQISLVFSEAMNQAAVETRFSLVATTSSAVAVTWSWSGTTATVTPSSLAPGGRYLALLSGNCTDAEGDLLAGTGGTGCAAPNQCSTFVVSDGTVSTVLVSPAAGATGVGLQPTITLVFSEPMETSSVVARYAVGANALPGSVAWIGSTVLNFVPAPPLGCSVTVDVTIADGARDPSGVALADTCTSLEGMAFCSSFTTKPTHEVCGQCSTGCWDVKDEDTGCACASEVHVGSPPCSSASYCVGCTTCGDECGCPFHCHYSRQEIFEPCNCGQVCS